jgi:hypothetical protein
MDSPEGQQSIEVRDVLWNLVEDVQLDAKQRKLIWPDAESLDLEQSIQHIQKKGLLPIEWVIFRNLSVIPVFNGDAMADR